MTSQEMARKGQMHVVMGGKVIGIDDMLRLETGRKHTYEEVAEFMRRERLSAFISGIQRHAAKFHM